MLGYRIALVAIGWAISRAKNSFSRIQSHMASRTGKDTSEATCDKDDTALKMKIRRLDGQELKLTCPVSVSEVFSCTNGPRKHSSCRDSIFEGTE